MKMKANEPIFWNIQRTVRRALTEGALYNHGWLVHLALSPEDWDTLLSELGPKCDKQTDAADGVFLVMHSAGREIRAFCKSKQAKDTILIGLAIELSPEVFA